MILNQPQPLEEFITFILQPKDYTRLPMFAQYLSKIENYKGEETCKT